MANLLLIAIGPVQDFIAAGRRCQDLWYGSDLLSRLSAAAAKGVARHAKAEALVFPAGLGDPSHASNPAVANKIMVLLDEGLDGAAVARAARAALDDELEAIAKHAFDRVKEKHNGRVVFHRVVAEAQVRDLIEWNWVLVEIDEDSGGYADARSKAESWLAARKATRQWSQPPWHQALGVQKCSLDGERESVLDEDLVRAGRRGSLDPETLRSGWYVRAGERLSGVGLVKRVGQEAGESDDASSAPPFHSTSHIASAAIRVRIATAREGPELLDRFIKDVGRSGLSVTRSRIRAGRHHNAFVAIDPLEIKAQVDEVPRALPTKRGATGNVGIDGVVLFPSRVGELVEESLAKGADTVAALRDVESAQRRLLAGLGVSGDPNPYLSVIVADGDRMGAALDLLAQGQDGPNHHREVSAALVRFAREASEITESYGGSVIFTGGDDVLVLCPLFACVALADRLRRAFGSTLAETGLFKSVPVPTLSVGIGVGHMMTPMDQLLDLGRAAERRAKVLRNSLALIVDKRSGGTFGACGAWDSDQPLHERLVTWMRLLHDNDAPDGVAFEIAALAESFEAAPQRLDDRELGPLVAALLRRIVARKRSGGGAELLTEDVRGLFENYQLDERPIERLRALSEEVQVARELLRSRDLAFGGTPC